jgi:hypothetical protein
MVCAGRAEFLGQINIGVYVGLKTELKCESLEKHAEFWWVTVL